MKKRNIIIAISAIAAVLLIAALIFGLISCRDQQKPQVDPTEGSGIDNTTAPNQETTEAPTEVQYDAEVGQVFEIIKLATNVNGENGVTYYYTEDGVNLMPFDEWHEGDGKWIHGENGVLFYPALVPNDNYTAAGTSATEYVAMSYEIPETGAIELFSWTVLQGPSGEHGYRVKIAQGTPDNVLYQYDVEGDTQTLVHNTYGMKVTKGEKLYLIFEPLVKKDNEWFGFKAHITYTGLGEDAVPTNPQGDVNEQSEETDPMTVKFTSIVGQNNGMNGLTFYYTADGKNLTPLSQYIAAEGKWWHGGKGVLVYPKSDAKENYGIFGSSASEYIVMGYKLPATGTIDLAAWAVLQSGHDYQVKIALNSPTNVVKTMDIKGESQTQNQTNVQMEVKRGDVLYIHYKPLEAADGAWGGYKTQLTYISGGDDFQAFDPNGTVAPDASGDIKEGSVILFSGEASSTNPANGVYYYYTADGKNLTKFTESAGSGSDFRWVHGSDGVLIYPALVPANNYGLIGSSTEEYSVIGYQVPATGTVELFSNCTLQSGHDYQVRIAKGSPNNILYTFDVKGGSQLIVEKTYTINVNEGQMLYIHYKPLEAENGAWAGWKNQLTYVSVGTHTGPADPTPVDPDNPPEPELPDAKPVADLNDGVTKVLAIGNSFTVDTLEYVQKIAKSAGVTNVQLGKAVIGGSSIDIHVYNAKNSNLEYELGVSTEQGGWYTVYGKGLWEALQADNWDYIMIQQHSPNAGNPDSYGNLDYLLEYIAKYTHADSKVIFNMTWAYQSDSTHEAFAQYGNDQMTMYHAIISTTQSKIATRDDIAVILPTGTAVQNARTSYIGDNLTLDGYHMSYTEGRYTVGMAFAKVVLGVDLSQVTYTPAGVSDLYRQVAVECVNNAAQKPFEITASALTAEQVDTSNEVHRETVKFVDICNASNGSKGLTFYYTTDGVNLTAYTLYDAGQGRWYDNTDGQLNFFDPQEVRANNYGLGQCSDSKYVAMGYKAPETGAVDLFLLTGIQGPEGEYSYNVRVAMGTPDNTVEQYTVTGKPGSSQEERYILEVTKDQEIFIIYENLTDGGWFGYKNTVTYRTPKTDEAPEITVQAGDIYKAADIAPTTVEANNAGSMTIYYTSDLKNLTAFSTYDPNNHNGRWYHHDGTNMLSWVDPFADAGANYGWIGMTTNEFIAMSYKMPAAGTIDLYNWLALHNSLDVKIHIAKGTPENVVDTIEVVGGADFIGEKTTSLNVEAGEIVYVLYELLEPSASPDTSFVGYKTQYTYTAVAQPEPEYAVAVGDSFKAAEIAPISSAANGANGMTIYYTTDLQRLTAFITFDPNTHNGRWYHHDGTNMLSWVDPFADTGANYGWIGMTTNEFIAMSYKMPEVGTVELYNWLALHNGLDVKIHIAKGTPDNVVDTIEVVGGVDFIGEKTTTLNVEKDEVIYVLYELLEPSASPDTSYVGYKFQYTYTAVGPNGTAPTPDPEPEPEPEVPAVNVGDVFKFTALAGENNGDNGMTMYYTADGANLTPYSLYDAGQGRWYEVTNNAVTFFDPAENPTDNYGLGQTSASNYVVLGYKAPATGTIDLFSWTANQSGAGFRVSIAKGSLDNVVQTYDAITAGSPVYNTYSLNVTKGEELFLIYKPVTAADGSWFGYINQVTYTAVGAAEPEPEPEVPAVNVGDVFKFTALAGENNGDNGLTMYYTADGATLTPYSLYDAGQGRWYEVTNNAVTFFDPAENPADNYGLGQTSASNYVVLGYQIPASGKIDLFTWLVTQAGTGHSLTVCKGSLDNVVGTYSTTQGAVAYNTYSLDVTEGEQLYLIFKPTAAASGEWFGYQLSVTYTALNG